MIPPICKYCSNIATHVLLSDIMDRRLHAMLPEEAPRIMVATASGALGVPPTPYFCRECADTRITKLHEAIRASKELA